jgi:hypothetical protein
MPPKRPRPPTLTPRFLPIHPAPARPVIEIGADGKPKPSVVLAPRGSPAAPAPVAVEIKPYDLVPSVVLGPVTLDVPQADPTLKGRARAEALIAEVRRIKRRNASDAYRLGVIFNELDTPAVLTDLECESFRDVVARYELGHYATASRYKSIAAAFTEDEVTDLGTEKGMALVRYVATTGAASSPGTMVRNDIKLAGLAISAHTVVSLRNAMTVIAAKLRERADAADDTVQEVDRMVRKLGPKLRSHGAKNARLKRARRGSRLFVRIELDPDEAQELYARLFGSGR